MERVIFEKWPVPNPNAVWNEGVPQLETDESGFESPVVDESGLLVWEVEPGWVDAEGNPTTAMLDYKIKTTTYLHESSTPANPVSHREGNEPSSISELLDEDDNFVKVVAHVFSTYGNYYRTDGPTEVQGDPDEKVFAEYQYGDNELDVALEIAKGNGSITEEEYAEGMAHYANLPHEATGETARMMLGRSADHDLPFKDDVAWIVNLLDRDSSHIPPSSDSGSGSSIYDSGWVEVNFRAGDVFFRRVDYTVFVRGTVNSSNGEVTEIGDLTGQEYAPEHPISLSAHYEADKTISNPVYNEGAVLKVNSQNGQSVVFSGSWSVTSPIPGTATNVVNLTAEPSDTSVVLTWDVE